LHFTPDIFLDCIANAPDITGKAFRRQFQILKRNMLCSCTCGLNGHIQREIFESRDYRLNSERHRNWHARQEANALKHTSKRTAAKIHGRAIRFCYTGG